MTTTEMPAMADLAEEVTNDSTALGHGMPDKRRGSEFRGLEVHKPTKFGTSWTPVRIYWFLAQDLFDRLTD
ncbi:uncharacterized protein N7484_001757 [Penicillium longicatenatum]|uniref:uncharacterized protein n=1 Tax=Penicillium longicatenatum TaxID=1561947 RepID=UPI0025494C89|nr:uncharacterized protein N7484_001757 [Penicillium longicatenatum]KAJ5658108.1 hypothetical protein N7484_001757 [Penicillium longicatenatum]